MRDEAQRKLDQMYDDDVIDEADTGDGDIDDVDDNVDAFSTSPPSPTRHTISVPEPYSRHARHRIAVHIKSEHIHTGAIEYNCMFMQVETCLILPILEATPRSIDFGQVPLGRSVTRSIEVKNTSNTESFHLSHETLGFAANFTVLNALRLLKPGEIQIVVIEFHPRREGKHFKQDLILRSEENPNIRVTVPLLGLCISPNLELVLDNVPPDQTRVWPKTNEDLEMQLLHLGDCVVGDTITRTFTLKNLNIYPYAYHLTQHEVHDGSNAHSNVHGTAGTLTTSSHNLPSGSPVEFYFVPAAGLIPPNGGTVQITMHFSPTTPTMFFPYQTIVEVGNQRLKIQAEVHERQLFIKGGRQVPINDLQSHLPNPSLQQQLQESSFQNKSLVAGYTNIASELIYQHPLAFLDGPQAISNSVGGGSIANSFPIMMTNDYWDRVLDELTIAPPKTVDEKGKRSTMSKKDGKKDSNKSDEKSSARGRHSFSSNDAGMLGQFHLPDRVVELTFDPSNPIDLSSLQLSPLPSASSKGRSRSSERIPTDSSSTAQVLVESLQIGNAVISSSLTADSSSTNNSKSSADKDSGSFEITIGSSEKERISTSRGASSALSSSSTDESLAQLFQAEPSTGILRVGSKEKINFLFDLTKYQQLKSAAVVRRVLHVGQWIHTTARILLKGGYAPNGATSTTQTIEVRLRVYID